MMEWWSDGVWGRMILPGYTAPGRTSTALSCLTLPLFLGLPGAKVILILPRRTRRKDKKIFFVDKFVILYYNNSILKQRGGKND